ncbi:hypothetical protein [Pseudomonas sp. RIT-PI-AD]|uniref:hypothetical protein n=1 Tax=Pseudomonas sp. RIT-PI-AD TaxID=3035294 RepID=UPI0021D95F53|nr:hypothetical protein [Pseudomonas sp. RIT-PI-AD]
MSSPLLRTGLAGLLSLMLAAPVLAGPGGPGPGGPGFGGPGFGHGGGGPSFGPRRGHGLPDAAREIWIGSTLYFLAAGTYYLWNAPRKEYVVVTPPPAVQTVAVGNYEVIAYPARGQSADQQARDRYECHSWAVGQSGFDPASAQAAPPYAMADVYRRALGACLSGRGYSIN